MQLMSLVTRRNSKYLFDQFSYDFLRQPETSLRPKRTRSGHRDVACQTVPGLFISNREVWWSACSDSIWFLSIFILEANSTSTYNFRSMLNLHQFINAVNDMSHSL